MPDTPLQAAAERVVRLVKKQAAPHLVASATAILEAALDESRRGRGRPRKVDQYRAAIIERAQAGEVAEVIAQAVPLSAASIRKVIAEARAAGRIKSGNRE